MTDQRPMPILRVYGNHRAVGQQIGAACREAVRSAVEFDELTPSVPSRTMAEQLLVAAQYREVTRRHLPWVLDELDGVAEAADIDPLHLFAASTEEIWAPRGDAEAGGSASVVASPRGRCTDVVAGPPATKGAHLIVAHNNDLDAAVEPHITAIEWRVTDEAPMFTIGIGPWISVGWNSRGLLVSGNEVQPNDVRPGIPRLLLVRAQLREITLAAAQAIALHSARASAYNTVFAHQDGQLIDVEASATAFDELRLDETGVLAHTNHYICPVMSRFEGDPDYAQRSAIRQRRVGALMAEHAARPGTVTTQALRATLADHVNAPDSVCRHPTTKRRTKTVFWCVTDVTSGDITFGLGNPCRSAAQRYRFDAAVGPTISQR